MNHKIAVIGMGYVGCGNGLMLAKNFNVSIMDIDFLSLLPIPESKELAISTCFGKKVYSSLFFGLRIINIFLKPNANAETRRS